MAFPELSSRVPPERPAGASSGTPRARDWRDLRARLISASLLLPAGLFCVWYGGPLFAVLLLLLLITAGLEWAAMLQLPRRSLRGVALPLWPSVACLAALVTGHWQQALLMLSATLVLGPAIVAGTVAIGLGGLSLLWLRLWPVAGQAMPEQGLGWSGIVRPDWGGNWDAVLFVVLVVIASDSGAYLVGRAIGGPKLAPSISPGKTRSGALGGLVAAALLGAVLAVLLPAPGALARWAALDGACTGLLLGAVAQAGDLAESAFKRRCGVKDSGRLIPGHGGVLDRFDGLLAAAPVAALLSLLSPAGAAFWFAGAGLLAGGAPARPF